MIRDKNPDLVIRMPVLDGLALIQAADEEMLDTEFVIGNPQVPQRRIGWSMRRRLDLELSRTR